jgi:CheY-like chemotaxis protein
LYDAIALALVNNWANFPGGLRQEVMSFQILLLEDSDNDAFFFERALEAANGDCVLTHVHSIKEASTLLNREHPFAHAPTPDLVVSDCRLNGEWAMDLLEWMRSEARLKDIRFVFLCSELQPAVLERAKELRANEILEKPFSQELLRGVVGGIVQRGRAAAAGREPETASKSNRFASPLHRS